MQQPQLVQVPGNPGGSPLSKASRQHTPLHNALLLQQCRAKKIEISRITDLPWKSGLAACVHSNASSCSNTKSNNKSAMISFEAHKAPGRAGVNKIRDK